MSDEGIDAIGTAVEGAAIARAVEPERGNWDVPLSGDGHFDENACRNCGTALTGDYCSGCGQKAHLHRTLTAFWHDLVHGALHFDGKLWRTLPLLVRNPGELTRRYIDGERARFVSPMALFLFAMFLMFAVFQAIGLTTPTRIDTRDGLATSMSAVQERVEERIALYEEELADGDVAPEDRARLEGRLAESREELEGLTRASELVGPDASSTEGNMTPTGIDFIDKGIIQKWRENPSLMLYKLQANSYKFSWALIPLSVPFVWLLFFWKRRFKAYDHAIFVTYSLAFMSLLFVLVSALGKAGIDSSIIALSAIFIPPIHIYKQLRGTYELSRWGAFWRLCVLGVFISVVITLFLQILLLLGAF